MGKLSKAVLFTAVLSLLSCKREPPSARIDAAIRPLIPAQTAILSGLRLDKLKGTAFFQRYIEGKKLRQLDEFQQKTGLDPRKDIWEILWAASKDKLVMFVRGKFGGEFGLEPPMNMPDVRRDSYKGFYMLVRGDEGVIFFNTGVAAVGRVKDLRAIVDSRDNVAEKPPERLISMLEEVPNASQFWAVTESAGQFLGNLPAKGNITQVGRALIHARLDDDIRLNAEAQYADAATAKQAQDFLKAMAGMARLSTPTERKEALQALDGLEIRTQENNVKVEFRAPLSLIDDLLKLMPKQAASASPQESRPQDSSSPRPH